MNAINIPGFTAEASLDRTGSRYRMTDALDDRAGRRGVLAQADDTVWTTSTVCEACGCTVSGFICNCGLRPSERKLECIRNGGPKKAVAFRGGALGRYL
jgi:hypothetical protein